MFGASLLTVGESAGLLGLTPVAVRRRIEVGSLPATKYGREWLLDRADVERSARLSSKAGRVMSASMAWSVLLLASGEPERAAAMAGSDRYRARARAWLDQHSLVDDGPRLRGRAVSEPFDVHPSELRRLVARDDVLPTGASVARVVGLVGGADAAEFYAPAGLRRDLVAQHGMEVGNGAVRVRWVADDVWELLLAGQRAEAPRAAVLVDLLEGDDPRARREAARALTS